jgi:hypothetical protein
MLQGVVVALVAAVGAACSGGPGESVTIPVPPAVEVPGASDPQDGVACVDGAPFAPARVWLLSDEQYVNVVRDVFGVTLIDADKEITTGKSVTGEYSNMSEQVGVGTPEAESYERAAAKLAPLIVAKLPSLVPACAEAIDTTCVESFVRDVVPQAWRRPLTDSEKSGLVQLYTDAAQDGATTAAATMIEATLESASFLYRTEVGIEAADARGAITLSTHETASALSFMFLESSPDAELRAKADDGSLASQDVLAAQVDRLMAIPEARATMTKKVSYWADAERIPLVQKDADLFPEWTAELRAALYADVQAQLGRVVAMGAITDLISPFPVESDPSIVAAYGGTSRPAGLLTHPGILAATDHREGLSDPVHRGLYIYERYICGSAVASPPANAQLIAASMQGTERERAAQRARMSCGACHSRFDPLGLSTEGYDPIGRDAPNVDSSAIITGMGPDLDGPVAGIGELAIKLKTGRRVADCAAGALEKYALGYSPEVEQSCALRDVKNAFAKTGSFLDFFRALAVSPAFRSRDARNP